MADTLPIARAVLAAGAWTGASDRVLLDYDQRFLRRKRLTSEGGTEFLVDLGGTTNLSDGDALDLGDGRIIAVTAAEEPLYEIHGHDLIRLAWHIGNRHTPCQIEAGRLLIRRDHVLADMVSKLGGHVHEVVAPFRPEGGAYGTGRTMGHDHGHDHHQGHAHVHHHGGYKPVEDDEEDVQE